MQELFLLLVEEQAVAQNGVGAFQGTELVQTLNYALAVGLQAVFLISQILSHVHMQSGAMFTGEFNGSFKQVVVNGERGV